MAWRMLIERHLVPVTERRVGRFDEYLHVLASPVVVSLVEAWRPALEKMFAVYSRLDAAMGYATSDTAASILEQASNTMSYAEFLHLCAEKRVAPELVNIKELEGVFRRTNAPSNSGKEDMIQDMNYQEYVDALCLIALYVYSKPAFSRQNNMPAQKIEAFFTYIGLKKPTEGQGQPETQKVLKVPQTVDPYAEWWGMKFDDNNGTELGPDHIPSLILESAIPPEACPPEVGAILEAAFEAHNDSRLEESLGKYAEAKDMWLDVVKREKLSPNGVLPVEEKLYFAVACGGVHQSGGQYAKAMDLYQEAFQEVSIPVLMQGVSTEHHSIASVERTALAWPLVSRSFSIGAVGKQMNALIWQCIRCLNFC
ncbi:unnamed protein product [Ostreobium quekettii]|uniref:Uncharacterized protein n=1 Tax=Ostreobium quekettii TaxID=121088 RepID=A0A8S1IN68_9CHLO|nr:unnamed protein product [Ostreobium quekettii]